MDKSLRQSIVIALLVAGALFMEQLDGTVIATALPQMAQSFGVAAVDLNIGMSACRGSDVKSAASVVTLTLVSLWRLFRGFCRQTWSRRMAWGRPRRASWCALRPS